MPAWFTLPAMPNNHTVQFKGFDDYIEVFRAGKQTSSDGATQNFTHADLDEMVANHQPSPIVIGHPKTDSPAYGWSTRLKREGDVLLGKYSDVEKQFEKMVEDKRFPNRSVRIRKTDNGWKLLHTGWLGAVPPAVEGLKPVEYNEADDQSFDFMSDAYTTNVAARIFRRLREFLIAKYDQDTADQVLPDYEIEGLHEAAVEQRIIPDESFSQPDTGDIAVPKEYTVEEIEQIKKDAVAEFSSENNDLKHQLKTSQQDNLKIEFQAHVDELINKGKLTPALATGAIEFMLSISDDTTDIEFSQGDGGNKTEVKQSPLDWFKAFTGQLGRQVDFEESDAGDRLINDQHEFNAPLGAVVDPDRLALHHKAEAYMKQHDCDYVEAVVAVDV